LQKIFLIISSVVLQYIHRLKEQEIFIHSNSPEI
jgi:hypothetical protein